MHQFDIQLGLYCSIIPLYCIISLSTCLIFDISLFYIDITIFHSFGTPSVVINANTLLIALFSCFSNKKQ